ncbi:MAG TPA: YbaB/EbfC family nucleoid-associated protein [Pseudonocardiaceae bacterium]|nr:YbaB/EbfC family nucleoid-associated protein [Pseudonocardiaceae bacterium]
MGISGEERSGLDARADELRAKVSGLAGEFDRRAEQLRAAQQAAAGVRVALTSNDGLMRAAVGADGMLAELWIAPTAYGRIRPEQLAREIAELVRRATTEVRRKRAELLRSLTESVPDVSSVVPSLAERLPKIPYYPAPAPAPTRAAPPSARPQVPPAPHPVAPQRPAPVRRPAEPPDEDMTASWLVDDDF